MADTYTEGVCHDGAAILRNGERMTIAEILAALNATTTPPADAALADDALCESLIEASDMRWNGDVYVGDGSDLMSLVRAALRARAVPQSAPAGFVEWLCQEMPPGTVISDPAWWAPKIHRAMLAASKEDGK